jgi:hypothetical protein
VPDRELLVRILGDDRDLQRALTNTDRRLTAIDDRTARFGRNVGRAFAAAGIAVGTAALFDALGDSVEAASALNEELSKSRQVFGDSSQAIEAWSETTAQAFGISQRAALEATGVFGNLFRVVDLAPDQAADMSQALVQLAADLASFNNADPSDVLQALRSGLIGEVEPLRRYGVLLSEARVQQEAMAATGKDNVKELTNQEKALARYNIILQDTAPAQGDFARTSGGLANQSRILRAQLANLSAELGQNLVPILITATRAANGLFDAFDALSTGLRFDASNTDINELAAALERARAQIVGVTGDSHLMVRALDDALAKIREFQSVQSPRPDDRSGLRGPGAIAITNAQVDARLAERAAAEARQAQRRRQKAFDEFIKGQGLKLDQAALTKTLNDDLAVLRAIEAAIKRRIASEGRTFELVQQLTDVRQEIARTVEDQAAAAEQAGQDAFDATIDALTLDLDTARTTKSLADDQAALRALEQAILRRIASEGQTTDLMRQLFQVRQEQAAVAKQLADQRRQARQSQQFEALGLTAEGQERTPGIGALRRRGRGLIDELKASGLDEDQVAKFVQRISVIFTDQFDKAGRDVRQAILQLFQTINQALDQGTKAGPLTQTTALRTKKILAGLGLSPEEINALRGRLSSFNSGGVAPAGFLSPGVNAPSGGFAAPIVESTVNVTVTLDGQKVGKAVTKEQQKAKRRNPRQKRGPNRNI